MIEMKIIIIIILIRNTKQISYFLYEYVISPVNKYKSMLNSFNKNIHKNKSIHLAMMRNLPKYKMNKYSTK